MEGTMRPWGGGAALVLAGLAALLLGLATFSAWQGVERLRGRAAARTTASATARAFAEAYGSFDYHRPDAQHLPLRVLTTGALHDALVAAGPDPLAVSRRQVITAQARAARVTALAGDGATVVVTTEERRQGIDPATGEERRAHVRRRLRCRLRREGGGWRVAAVQISAEEALPPMATS